MIIVRQEDNAKELDLREEDTNIIYIRHKERNKSNT